MSFNTKGDKAVLAPDLNTFTAFATCGVPWHIEHLADDHGGKEVTHFYLEPAADPELTASPGLPVSPSSELESSGLSFRTGPLLALLKQGQLEQADPTHPIMDCLHGLHIRECLLSSIKRGRRYRITPLIGTGRFILEEGEEPLRLTMGQPGFKMIRTDSLNLSCALIRCGFPMLDIIGQEPNCLFVHARHQSSPSPCLPLSASSYLPLSASPGPPDALLLAQSIQDGSLALRDPGHQALWVINALLNRAALLSHLNHGAKFILIRDPRSDAWVNSKRCATVKAGSAAQAFDQALKFIRS